MSRASLWRFSNKALTARPDTDKIRPQIHNTVLSSSIGRISGSSDALERGAVGQTGMRVWQALLALDKSTLPAAIASRAGLTVGQVQYALRPDGWLRKAGLVERIRAGWLANPATDEELDERIARPAGKPGKGQARQQGFADERAVNAGMVIVEWRQKHEKKKKQDQAA